MNPYSYKRSSRSWVNVVFSLSGAVLVLAGFAELRLRWFGAGRDFLFFIFTLGGLFCVGGIAGFLVKREWEMQIDEHRLAWKDGRRGGELKTEQIKKVRIEEGDGRCLVVEMENGVRHTIPVECYGDACGLRAWFRVNFGDTLEVLN